MPHRAPHDPAQHIAAPLIGGQHAIGHQEARAAQVIGDHTMARLRVTRGGRVGQRPRRRDQRLERIGIVIVVDALHHRGDALQPHTGVDRRPRQVADDRIRLLHMLHEHQVPDFDEAVAVLVRAARRAAGDVIAMVVEDFRTRPARPVRSHRPEIVLGRDADDALIGQPGNLLPQIGRLIVGMIDRDGELVRRQPPFAGQQRPRMRDRLFLEIIPERKIAEHFEEGVMPRGIADIVQIVVLAARAHALLRAGRGGIGARFQTGEDVLERHHPSVDEHQRRIVLRHQRRGGHDAVAAAAEIVEERAANVVGRSHNSATEAEPARATIHDARAKRPIGGAVPGGRPGACAGSNAIVPLAICPSGRAIVRP